MRSAKLILGRSRRCWPAAILGLLIMLVAGWHVVPRPGSTGGLAWASGSGDPPQVLHIYGVGGILTADGNLWQYRPDLDKWLTIDDAFRQEGRETTKVLPLPVPADQIAEMVSWGFLLSKSGDVWFYEIAKDKWRRLDPPGN